MLAPKGVGAKKPGSFCPFATRRPSASKHAKTCPDGGPHGRAEAALGGARVLGRNAGHERPELAARRDEASAERVLSIGEHEQAAVAARVGGDERAVFGKLPGRARRFAVPGERARPDERALAPDGDCLVVDGERGEGLLIADGHVEIGLAERDVAAADRRERQRRHACGVERRSRLADARPASEARLKREPTEVDRRRCRGGSVGQEAMKDVDVHGRGAALVDGVDEQVERAAVEARAEHVSLRAGDRPDRERRRVELVAVEVDADDAERLADPGPAEVDVAAQGQAEEPRARELLNRSADGAPRQRQAGGPHDPLDGDEAAVPGRAADAEDPAVRDLERVLGELGVAVEVSGLHAAADPQDEERARVEVVDDLRIGRRFGTLQAPRAHGVVRADRRDEERLGREIERGDDAVAGRGAGCVGEREQRALLGERLHVRGRRAVGVDANRREIALAAAAVDPHREEAGAVGGEDHLRGDRGHRGWIGERERVVEDRRGAVRVAGLADRLERAGRRAAGENEGARQGDCAAEHSPMLREPPRPRDYDRQ